MPRRLSKLLEDVRLSAHEIRQYTTGMSLADYLSNKTIRRATEREFEIIGEALRRISDEFPASFDLISDARRIVNFRNVLSHGYDIVDDGVVWDIIETRLAILIREVEAMLREQG